MCEEIRAGGAGPAGGGLRPRHRPRPPGLRRPGGPHGGRRLHRHRPPRPGRRWWRPPSPCASRASSPPACEPPGRAGHPLHPPPGRHGPHPGPGRGAGGPGRRRHHRHPGRPRRRPPPPDDTRPTWSSPRRRGPTPWRSGSTGRSTPSPPGSPTWPADFDLFHTQDCIAARAAARVAGRRPWRRRIPVVRTVHHVDDFTTAKLIDCQRQAIFEPDRVLVVSRHWQELLRQDYGVDADVIHNGVDAARFAAQPPPGVVEALRDRIGAGDRFVFLAVGRDRAPQGQRPPPGGAGRASRRPAAMLAVVGGHSFQDYTAYRDAALASSARPRPRARAGTSCWSAPSPTTSCGPGTTRPTPSPSRRSRRGGAWPCWRRWPPACRWWPPTSPCSGSTSRPASTPSWCPPPTPPRWPRPWPTLMADADLRRRLVDAGRQVAARFTWADAARRHLEVYRSALG